MTLDSIADLKDNNIVIPLDIKKAGEGIPHNTLKQTLYRYINNDKLGKYFQHKSKSGAAVGPPIKLHHTEGTAFLECCKNYDGTGLQPDITFISHATKKPDTVIEIIDSNIPSVDKILAYIKEDINVIVVKTSEVTYDQGCKHICPANIIFKTDTIDEKIKKAFYICFKINTERHGSLCIGHNENNDEYFLGSVEENPEGVTIDYHVASRPTVHNGKVSTKKNEKVNKLAEEFVKNTHRRAKTSALNNGGMYPQLSKWKNFRPRGVVSKEQFNEPIKKRSVHYWRLDL